MTARIERAGRGSAAAVAATTVKRRGSRRRGRREIFSAGELHARRAPFALRCGAMLIDYILLAGIIAAATIFSRMFGGGNLQENALINGGYLSALAVAAINFIVLPLLAGQTAGKWATGLQLVRRDGSAPGVVNVLLRQTIGYLLSIATLGVGFAVAIFHADGRALHDLISGTAVVVVHRPSRRIGGRVPDELARE